MLEYLFCFILLLVILFLVNRLTCGTNKTATCLIGKTAIVTGGNSGIGYEVALILASRGCKVIIADKEISEKTLNKIIDLTGNNNITLKFLDLASLKSVRKFAEDINKTEKELHLLINNAGVGAAYPTVTEDGLNSMLQINHYGPFLLSHLLVDLLKKTAPSRIVFTTSIFQLFNNLNEENLKIKDYNITDHFTTSFLYGNSKLCSTIVAKEFASRLKAYNVTCYSVHPGAVRTKFMTKVASTKKIEKSIMAKVTTWIWNIYLFIVGKSSWEGAQTTIYVSTSNEVEHATGKFFADCCVSPYLSSKANNPDICKMVWNLSEKLVNLKEKEKL